MNDYKGFKEALSQSKNIVVLAGAGLSAASGIPTFRGAGGWWRKYNATDLATPDAFARDPALVWQFYHYRREVVMKAEPNAAHRLIARLCSSPSSLAEVAPSAISFRLVTQNIDNLSTRSLPPDAPASAFPMEIHGNICRVRCTNCSATHVNMDPFLTPALAASMDDNDLSKHSIELKDLPHCDECGSLLRPDVVWFGESTHNLDEIADIITKECDLLLVVGTSASVLPCGIFPDLVRDAGGKVAVFNLEATYTDRQSNFIFHGPCEETLLKAFGKDME